MVLDTETTGFDPQRDRLITIGAVAVQDGEILLDDTCELMLKLSHNLASVTVHGITRDEARDGMEESEALEIFLDYLRDAVIVGHHIGHDIQFLNCCLRAPLRSDTEEPISRHHGSDAAAERRGRIAGHRCRKGFRWTRCATLFGVVPHDRHTAGGDAFLTAQIFLRLLRIASANGHGSLGSFCVP